MRLATAFVLLSLFYVTSRAEEDLDFYKLLEIEKDADNREIRKAFKKLALKMHPDKNTVRRSLRFKYFMTKTTQWSL